MKRSLLLLFFISSSSILFPQAACFQNAPSWALGGNTGMTFRNSIGTCSRLDLILKTNDTSRVLIQADGRFFFGKKRIAADHPHANSYFQVDGKLACQELVVVDPNKWADFVFYPNYQLMPLTEVEQFYKGNKHLPDVPSEEEIKNRGLNVAEIDAILLQKIEELTLYVVDLNKKIDQLRLQNSELEAKIKSH